MSEPEADTTPLIPLPVSKELRTLAHDLSNSIETIMQATYLLSQSKVDEADRKWLELIDQATRDAAKINRQIREVLRSPQPAAVTKPEGRRQAPDPLRPRPEAHAPAA